MYEYLKGSLVSANPSRCILEAGGIGYAVLISETTYDALPTKGKEARLFLHHVFNVDRNDQRFFGFHSEKERTIFRQLLEVQRVGPSLALKILGGGLDNLVSAIAAEDVAALKRIKGVGAKVAERMVVELKDPFSKLGLLHGVSELSEAGKAGATSQLEPDQSDAVLALVNLGYKPAESEKAVLAVLKKVPDADTATLIRQALQLV